MKRFTLIGVALVAVVALAATTAASSVAAVHWNYAGKELASGTREAITTKLKSSKLYFKWGAIKLELEATGVSTTEGYIEGNKNNGAKAIVFTGFKVVGAPVCTVKSPGQPNGTVATKEVKTFLHEVSSTAIDDVFTPVGQKAKGEEFFTMEVGGAECGVAQTAHVTGSFVAEAETPNTEATTQALNFPATALRITEGSETFGTLLFGGHEATLVFESNETAAEKFGASA